MLEAIRVRPLSRYAVLATLALTLGVGCSDCQEKKPAEPDMAKVEVTPEPDLGPKVDPLAEATEDAEKKAELAAVGVLDASQLVAANIEAAQTPTETVKKPSKPRISEPKETGTIAANDLAKVFRRYEGAMKKCYERALKRSPGLEGKVTLTVSIKTDGSVRAAKARGTTMNNSLVNSCMETLAKRMSFPPPTGGAARVNKSYSFTPAL